MHAKVSTILESIRQPKYTGENRCLPCTVVNMLIALVVAGIVWTLVTPLAGVVVFVGCLTAIALRGYIVPGTPELTKRYLPERIYRLFEIHRGKDNDKVPSEDVEGLLRTIGVVDDCHEHDDICLDQEFRQVWHNRIKTLRPYDRQVEAFADRLDVEDDELSLENSSGQYNAIYEGDRIARWPSESAFLADLALSLLLDEWFAEWQSFEPEDQGAVLTGLRVFLERCPSCDGKLSRNEETVETCCSTMKRAVIECEHCDSALAMATYR